MKQYEVERSNDGLTFSKVGIVASLNIRGLYQYNFSNEVNTVLGNKVYYRLKEVKTNNSFKYSKVISLTLNNHIYLSIKPNPANNYCVVSCLSSKNQIATLNIKDLEGKTIRTTTVNLSKGTNNISLNELGKLPSGSYIIQLYTENEILIGQLVIQH